MFVDYIAIVTVDCPSNGENITEVISFVKVWMNITGLVSLFHNEHVQHVSREREREGIIIRSSFCKIFYFWDFHQPSISSLHMVDTYR